MNAKPRIVGLLAALFTAASLSAAEVETTGFLKFEYWTGMPSGTAVSLLTDWIDAGNQPSITSYVSSFDSRAVFPDDGHEQYGAIISGWLKPTESGDYTFFLRSDDASELYLSTTDKEADLQLIAQQTGCCNAFTEPDGAGGPAYTSPPTTLQAGKKYFVKLLYKEGGGGDYGQMAWRKEGDTAPAGSLLPIGGGYLSSMADAKGGTVAITQQPQSQSVAENDSVTFTVAATTTTPYLQYPSTGDLPLGPSYQWYKNGGAIPGATGASYTIAAARKASDNGAKFKCVVAVPGLPQSSDEATLTVTDDVTRPTIASARPVSSVHVVVAFSEPVNDTALTAANYALSGGVSVSSVVRNSASAVTLTTSAQTSGTTYTLTANNVQDTGTPTPNSIAPNSQITFMALTWVPGLVLDKFWDNFAANTLAGLQGLATFPNSPDRVQFETAWEYPADGGGEGGSNYGNQLIGWFIAPESGDYVFFTTSDDPSALYLSTDENPVNKHLIATESAWSNPRNWTTSPGGSDVTAKRSDTYTGTQWPKGNTITLVKGSKYYLESLHTEGGGGDNVDVTYKLASEADPTDGDASRLTGNLVGFYLDPNGASLEITQQPADTTVLQGRTATLSVQADYSSAYGQAIGYQWQKAATGTSTFTDLAGATASSYTTPTLGLADSAQYRVLVGIPALSQAASIMTTTSRVAAVTVQADTFAPKISKVKATSVGSIVVDFDEPLDAASAGTASNYAISGGVTVSKAQASATSVLLTVSGLTVKASYTLTVGGVKDLYGNAMAAGTTFSFVANVVTYADVILADGPIGFYRFEETTGQITKNFGSAGSSADGLYMVGNGPDDSVPTDVSVAEGPRPGDFLGFDPNNRAVLMDGPNTTLWIDTQKQFLNNLKAFSLEYWVKPANRVSDPTAFGTRIGLVGQNDAVEYGFINQTTIQIWSSGGGSLDTAYSFPDNEWHHIATIADGKSIKNYYDGVLVGTGGSVTANYGASTFNVHIGGGGVYDATGNFFTGQFDEVAIFDKAIPAERIAAHYQAGKQGGEAPGAEPVIKGITLQGGNVTISFDGTLQSAAMVLGPWTDVAGAPSGSGQTYSTAATAAQAYFRSRQ